VQALPASGNPEKSSGAKRSSISRQRIGVSLFTVRLCEGLAEEAADPSCAHACDPHAEEEQRGRFGDDLAHAEFDDEVVIIAVGGWPDDGPRELGRG
jgi:hypothetical protein